MLNTVIHVCCPLSASGVPLAFPKLDGADILPSPPQSPTKHHDNTIVCKSLTGQVPSNTCIKTDSWPASWKVIIDTISNHQQMSLVTSHQNVSFHDGFGFITNVLNWHFGKSKSQAKPEGSWDAYMALMHSFADVIVAQQPSPRDTIWIHDYELVMLPTVLRQKLPRARIHFALYAPFPTEKIPNSLLESMLAADHRSFQSALDLALFKAAVFKATQSTTISAQLASSDSVLTFSIPACQNKHTNNITPRMLLQRLALPRLVQPSRFIQTFQTARRRLLLFDYDGTLTPIVANPSDAKPTPALLQSLQRLCDDPKNTVWVVSGRDQATLEAWLGSISGLGLSAEHGSFMRQPGQTWVDMLTQSGSLDWKQQALAVFHHITAETPGTVVEEKKSSITWHYRNALDPQFALAQRERAFHMLQSQLSNVDILHGKMNLEVRSARVNKGQVVQAIQAQVQADFVLCAGDDRTDEDMFAALANEPAMCVSIGPQDRKTVAGWYIETPEAFVDCIHRLTI